MAVNIGSDNWQDFDITNLSTIQDCYDALSVMDDVIGGISQQLFVAEAKIKKGDGHEVNNEWYAAATAAMIYAKKKRKLIEGLKAETQRAKNYILKEEEKDRTRQIIDLLERVAISLESIVKSTKGSDNAS